MRTLFLSPLYSGSSGNATWVCHEDTAVLIDAGVSCAAIVEAIAALPHKARVRGILVTHEHSDHIRGLGAVSRKLDAPIYATAPTWEAMRGKLGNINPAHARVIEKECDFFIGDLCVRPFAIPHDAQDPVGYRVLGGGACIALATDIGHVSAAVLRALSEASVILLESNHDLNMLRYGPYPERLKKRILSRNGHLSNPDCAKALCTLAGFGVRKAVLGHLSKDNNTPQTAEATVSAILSEAGIRLGVDLEVSVAGARPGWCVQA